MHRKHINRQYCNLVLLYSVSIITSPLHNCRHRWRWCWSIRSSYWSNAPAPGPPVDRVGPWLSYKPRVDPIGDVFGSYEPIRCQGVLLCCSCVVYCGRHFPNCLAMPCFQPIVTPQRYKLRWLLIGPHKRALSWLYFEPLVGIWGWNSALPDTPKWS